jgi:hypothetical protein
MRSRFALTILLCGSVPAFSQTFTFDFVGGVVNFGAGSMNIAVVPGGGTNGKVTPAVPPASISCKPAEAVTLAGLTPFVIRGTVTEFGHLWDIELAFPGPPYANQGNLTISSIFWELTGKYTMTIKDTVTGKQCSKQVGMSGEYQFEGGPLAGWPHDCKQPTSAPGQSPGLEGAMTLHGHAGNAPKFVAGGSCSAALATQANSKIGSTGFKAANLNYKLTY